LLSSYEIICGVDKVKNILSASIIPCVLFYSEGEFIAEFKSSLFDTKGYNFLSDSNFNFYRDLKAGWKRSPEGFATYTIYFNEYKIVFTGMKVKSISDVRGKNIGIPLYISEKNMVENYVFNLLDVCKSYTKQKLDSFQDYTHELKKIVSDIYHKTLEIKENSNLNDYHKELAESICALTNMISTKSDIMTFLTTHDLSHSLPEDNIGIHKKFLKIVKCFKLLGKKKGIDFNLSGTSFKSISRGPAGFEIIPYLLVENAIKYSPEQYDINICFEDKDDGVEVIIDNVGPEIEKEDLIKIFHKGYRGKSAQNTTSTGKGLGLYIAKEFLEKGFGGKIDVEQDGAEIINLNSISYRNTTFKVFIPI